MCATGSATSQRTPISQGSFSEESLERCLDFRVYPVNTGHAGACSMIKILLWIVAIIFIIGLLVVTGVLKLIF